VQGTWGALAGKAAGAFPKEGTHPVNQVGAYPSPAAEREQDRSLHIVEAALYIQKQGREFVPE